MSGPGIKFGHFTLGKRLARGGMAEVFLARQRGPEGFDRRVAVKRILPHLAETPDFVRMFLDEARLAARLSHPNIVHIYELGQVDGDYFIAMEFVDGIHAGQLVAQAATEPLPPVLAARLGADAAGALAYAHRLEDGDGRLLQLVHRDVSPHNIMVSFDGVTKLVDFGIAKAALKADETRPGIVKGKYAYMSPEQTVGRVLDGRSDVFSLGIVLWEILAGTTIVDRGDVVEAMKVIRDGRWSPIEKVAPRTPPALAQAIGWALAHKRDDRATASQLQVALEEFIKRAPQIATSVQLADWIRPRFPRNATGAQASMDDDDRAAARPRRASGPVGTSAGRPAPPPPAGTQNVRPLPRTGTAQVDVTDAPVSLRPGTVKVDVTDAVPSLRPSQLADAAPIARSPIGTGAAPALRSQAEPAVPSVRTKAEAAVPSARSKSDSAVVPPRTKAEAAVPSSRTNAEAAVPSVRSKSAEAVMTPPAGRAVPPPLPASVRAPTHLDAEVDVPEDGPDAPTRLRIPSTVMTAPSPEPGTSRVVIVLAIAVALAVAIGIAALIAGGGSHRATATDAAILLTGPDAAPEVIALPGDPPDAAPAPPDAATADAALADAAAARADAGTARTPTDAGSRPPPDRRTDARPPEPGFLTARTTPYSVVTLNGKVIGETPFSGVALPAGTHTLTFTNPDRRPVKRTVRIRAGQTLKLSFTIR